MTSLLPAEVLGSSPVLGVVAGAQVVAVAVVLFPAIFARVDALVSSAVSEKELFFNQTDKDFSLFTLSSPDERPAFCFWSHCLALAAAAAASARDMLLEVS